MSAPATPQNGRAVDTAENAIGALNAKTRQRQRMLLLGGGGAVAMVGLWFVLGGSPHHISAAPDAPQRIETDGIVNRDLSQKEFVAIYGNRLDAQARQLKALEDCSPSNKRQKMSTSGPTNCRRTIDHVEKKVRPPCSTWW